MTRHLTRLPRALAALPIVFSLPLLAQVRITEANYAQAEKYSSEFLRQFSYSTAVTPGWIGKTDVFWYQYKTSAGTRYCLVDAEARTKEPLFDHDYLAAALSESLGKAFDGLLLELGGLKVDDTGKQLTFTLDGFKFRYELSPRKLTNEGKATPTGPRTPPPNASEEDMREFQRRMREERGQQQEQQQEQQQQEQQQQQQEEQEQRREENQQEGQREGGRGEQTVRTGGRGAGGGAAGGAAARSRRPVGSFAPDRKTVVFARDHNLFVMVGTEEAPAITESPAPSPDAVVEKVAAVAVEAAVSQAGAEKALAVKVANGTGTEEKVDEKVEEKAEEKRAEVGAGLAAAPAKPAASRPPSYKYDEKQAVQLSSDGTEDYTFGGRGPGAGAGGGGEGGGARGDGSTAAAASRTSSPASLTWSENSLAFYVTRSDSRGVKELYLVDSIADPRPTLQSYRYAMPGEQEVRTSELHVWHRDSGQLVRVPEKWKDESFRNVHWLKGTDEMRFLRIDRTLRHAEFCSCDPKTGAIKVLFSELAKDGPIFPQSVRYLEKRKQLLWWSDRAGWGHFYLHDLDGTLKNAVTAGSFRSSRILEVDEDQGWMWFRANGREKGECVYYEHLYRVRLDGTGLTLLDAGDAMHSSSLSPSRRFVVDNASRVDRGPTSLLRDAEGNQVMALEETDLTKLVEVGWKPPETFVVKAADGVTDLYGNLWKPFDFDAGRRYPIIVNVYPGPQQEGMSYTFSAHNGRQQLAQLGFIVIQVGHRGGAPTRSRRYANFGYLNMRDYGLVDKKAAIEQLAMRSSWIDRERVGIYGHSGGGFMTAAALMQPPYNDFFKVGVASSGNHDNNIYNNSWAERYHGLKEVEAVAGAKQQAGKEGTAKQEAGKEGAATQDAGKEGTAKQDAGKQEAGKQEAGKTDAGKQEAGKTDAGKEETGKQDSAKKGDAQVAKGDASKQGDTKTGGEGEQGQGTGAGTAATAGAKKSDRDDRFEIRVPTNAELAANLKGHLLLVHGEIDNNVHPANTMRLVDALIKAGKRFDMLIIPGARHGFGRAQDYFNHRTWDFFVEHLIGDRPEGADIRSKPKPKDG